MDSEISVGCGPACRLMCCLRDKSVEIAQVCSEKQDQECRFDVRKNKIRNEGLF